MSVHAVSGRTEMFGCKLDASKYECMHGASVREGDFFHCFYAGVHKVVRMLWHLQVCDRYLLRKWLLSLRHVLCVLSLRK